MSTAIGPLGAYALGARERVRVTGVVLLGDSITDSGGLNLLIAAGVGVPVTNLSFSAAPINSADATCLREQITTALTLEGYNCAILDGDSPAASLLQQAVTPSECASQFGEQLDRLLDAGWLVIVQYRGAGYTSGVAFGAQLRAPIAAVYAARSQLRIADIWWLWGNLDYDTPNALIPDGIHTLAEMFSDAPPTMDHYSTVGAAAVADEILLQYGLAILSDSPIELVAIAGVTVAGTATGVGAVSAEAALSLALTGTLTDAGANIEGAIALASALVSGALSGVAAIGGGCVLGVSVGGTLEPSEDPTMAALVTLGLGATGTLSALGSIVGTVQFGLVTQASIYRGDEPVNGGGTLGLSCVGALSGVAALVGAIGASLGVTGTVTDGSYVPPERQGRIAPYYWVAQVGAPGKLCFRKGPRQNSPFLLDFTRFLLSAPGSTIVSAAAATRISGDVVLSRQTVAEENTAIVFWLSGGSATSVSEFEILVTLSNGASFDVRFSVRVGRSAL